MKGKSGSFEATRVTWQWLDTTNEPVYHLDVVTDAESLTRKEMLHLSLPDGPDLRIPVEFSVTSKKGSSLSSVPPNDSYSAYPCSYNQLYFSPSSILPFPSSLSLLCLQSTPALPSPCHRPFQPPSIPPSTSTSPFRATTSYRTS